MIVASMPTCVGPSQLALYVLVACARASEKDIVLLMLLVVDPGTLAGYMFGTLMVLLARCTD